MPAAAYERNCCLRPLNALKGTALYTGALRWARDQSGPRAGTKIRSLRVGKEGWVENAPLAELEKKKPAVPLAQSVK